MNRLMFAAMATMVCASSHAATMLEQITPHVGKVILLSAGSELQEWTVTSVGGDNFCVAAPSDTERCYPGSRISRIVRTTKEGGLLSVSLDLPKL